MQVRHLFHGPLSQVTLIPILLYLGPYNMLISFFLFLSVPLLFIYRVVVLCAFVIPLMSVLTILLKRFSVVGLTLMSFFQENTKLRSEPAGRPVCRGTYGLGRSSDVETGMGLGLSAARAAHRCARKSRSASCTH